MSNEESSSGIVLGHFDTFPINLKLALKNKFLIFNKPWLITNTKCY